jgi:hypothetical protein
MEKRQHDTADQTPGCLLSLLYLDNWIVPLRQVTWLLVDACRTNGFFKRVVVLCD